MRIHIRVDDETYEVEVGDLSASPIVAVVDGQRFEVWPEGAAAPNGSLTTGVLAAPVPGEGVPRRAGSEERVPPAAPTEAAASCPPSGPDQVRAPIPGVIESIAVRPGDNVARGQELLVLEAMKMKNLIRAPRAGTVVAVHVTTGKHIKHGDPLVELKG